MKVFKSIKWRLQIWYGLILVVVLAGFGFTAYVLEWNQQVRRIDGQFEWRRDFLVNALHRPPRGLDQNGMPFDRPPPGLAPDDGPRGPGPRPPFEFHLPPDAVGVFEADAPNNPENFFFVIQSPEGGEIARSTNVPGPFADDLEKRFSKWHSLMAPGGGGSGRGLLYDQQIPGAVSNSCRPAKQF